MNKIVALILTLALYPAYSFAGTDSPEVVPVVAQPAVSEAEQPEGNVYVVRGEVFASQDDSTPKLVNITAPIVDDTLISTGENSAALLKFADGQVITLTSNTSLRVRGYHYDAEKIKNSDVDLVFYQGGLRFIAGQIGKQKKLAFKLLTPKATMRGGETQFLATKVGDAIYSRVVSGKISMTNSAGTADFKIGQTAGVSSTIILAAPVYNQTSLQAGFDELLAIPIDPSLVVPPAAPEPAPAPEPVQEATATPEPETVAEATPAVVPVPVVITEPEILPEVEPVPEPEPEPEPAIAPEPVTSGLVPEQAASCSCSCSCPK